MKKVFLILCLSLTSCKRMPDKKEMNVFSKNETAVPKEKLSTISNNIMVVFQDSKNNYWFGSWKDGVYRFDGKNIIHFTTNNGLANNRIDEIKEDELGNLYFNSCHPGSTISKFDGKKFTTLSPIFSNDWQLKSTDLWFRHAYQSEKVYRYDGSTLHELQLPKPPNLPNHFEIYSIYKDKKENIWFGTNPVGVCRYNGKMFEWITEEDVTEFRNEGANGVRSITEDKNGDFWFNCEYRYSVYDSSSLKSYKLYTRHKSIGSLDGKKESNLAEYLSTIRDKNNNLWFVTYRDGVWKYDGNKVTNYKVKENGKDILLFYVYKDNKGTIWLGTHENGVWKLKGNDFERFM